MLFGGPFAFLMYCMFNKLNHKILLRELTQRRRCCSRSRCHLKTSLENGFLNFETLTVVGFITHGSALAHSAIKEVETRRNPGNPCNHDPCLPNAASGLSSSSSAPRERNGLFRVGVGVEGSLPCSEKGTFGEHSPSV